MSEAPLRGPADIESVMRDWVLPARERFRRRWGLLKGVGPGPEGLADRSLAVR